MEGFSTIDVPSGEDGRDRRSSGGGQEKKSKQMEKSPQLPMSSEKNKSMFSKPYLAKSLDWDRDFLTSEGVLDYDELASLNSTFSKIEASSLSVIPESKISTETNSTLCDDDSLASENLEFYLFGKKGASMKTLGTGVRTSGSEKLNKKDIRRKGRTRSLELPTKVEVSQYKNKSAVVPGNRLQNTSRWGTVIAKAGYEGLPGGKTVSKPTSALPKSNLLTVPAKTICAPGSIQIGSRESKEKPGDVAVQKAVVAFKQLNKGSSSSVLKHQASKTTSNSTSDSSRWMRNSPPENTRMRCTSQTTNHSCSGSMANKASSSKSNINQAFSRSSTARTVHTSASNSLKSRGLSVELSLPTTPISCHNVGSVSSSSTICPVKSVMNGDEASSSTSSRMAVDANKIHTTNSKPSFDPVNLEDDSCLSHVSKISINNHAMPTSQKGNNSKNSPAGNRTGAIFGKPSGPIVPHSKLANSDVKKPANRNVGTLPQTSQQPKLLKAASQTNKSGAANKAKQTMSQHARPATKNKIMNGHLRTTASSRSSSMESLPFVQFEPSGSNGS